MGRQLAESSGAENPASAPRASAADWAASVTMTLVAIGVIEAASRWIYIVPSPGPILLLAVVYAAFIGGTAAGLVSALLVIFYTAHFFVHQPTSLHDGDQALRLTTIAVTAPVMAVLVGILRRSARQTEIIQSILRREQRAKEEAEAANRAKDDFLAALSHELRTPLTPVLLTATALENDPSISEDLRQQLSLMRRNVELEARLIDDLLDLTRIARGKLQLHLRVLDPHVCLDAALEVCRDELLSKGLRLTSHRSGELRAIHGDPARLQQVFWNIIKNAVKFTPSGGEIRVDARGEGDRWRLKVIDTGIGIAPELLPKIFDAFEQGTESINRQFGGLGMGLAISRVLVEMHGGVLAAASDGEGKGATFTIDLPSVDAPIDEPLAPQNPASDETRASRPLRILLVEDHDATSHVLVLLLRRLHHEVTAAPTIADARKEADRKSFDLLISDLGLPDGSGLDLMRELRAKFNVTGICLSGYGMDRDVVLSREAGFARHLTKPVDFRSLKATIESVTT